MALFQPTNITPDLLGGTQNGVVFANVGGNTVVSWEVNGSSPLVAYQIDFYKNDSASTQTGSTGKVTLSIPFSAVDAYGNTQRYEAIVPYTMFSGATSTSEPEGKLKITQWGGSTAAQSVAQRSLSVFRVAGSSANALSISLSSEADGSYDFSGTFSPDNTYGSTYLVWTRWRVLLQGTDESGNITEDTVVDTGRVWNATSYEWSTGQLAPGTPYSVEWSAETNFGEVISDTYIIGQVLGDAISIAGGLEITCDKSKQAVQISVSNDTSVSGTFTTDGHTVDENGNLLITSGTGTWAPPVWITEHPWSFTWRGTLRADDLLFTVQQTNGQHLSLYFDELGGGLSITPTFSSISAFSVAVGDDVEVTLSQNQDDGDYLWSVVQYHGDSPVLSAHGIVSGYTQAPISRVSLGEGAHKYFKITLNTGLQPSFAAPGFFFPLESDATRASAYIDLAGITGQASVFRQNGDGGLVWVDTLGYAPDQNAISVYDYSAQNNGENSYLAIVHPVGATVTAILTADPVTPCFWSWTILEASLVSYGKYRQHYIVNNAYFFTANVTTASMGNGSTPSVQNSLSRYPVVMRSTQNRRSGTLSGLIGSASEGQYTDSNAVMEALYALSTTTNQLFLRGRRGELMMIQISGEISMKIEDNSPKQQITASIPWVEVGSVDNVSITETVYE